MCTSHFVTKQKTSREASIQLAKKIKLENRFKPKIRRVFNQMARDVGTVYKATGGVANVRVYKTDIVALLRDHYRAVDKAFSKTTRNSIKGAFLQLETKQEDGIDLDIAEYIQQHSEQQTNFIINTTEDDIRSIIAGLVVQNSLRDNPLSREALGNEIQREFKGSLDGRVDVIAMTETQTPAEQFKFIEAGALAATATAVGRQMFKTWNTVLDERTRLSHVEADRQRVLENQPFSVQGESLMVPGDTSLGASLSNVINCRCSAVYNVEGEESAPLDIPRQLL